MDEQQKSYSVQDVRSRLGTARAPVLLDVRPSDAFAASDRIVVSASHRDPHNIREWQTDLPRGRTVIAFDDGEGSASDIASALRRSGIDAYSMQGGFAAWRAAHLPTRRQLAISTAKWVTRERPKIDRIACPWLISRFIDPAAAFIYVPAAKVFETAKEIGGNAYDIEGASFAHEGERCSFDTLLRVFDIRDLSLDHLATIVRGADTSRHDLAAQCSGLFAISLGLSANFADDHEMLAHGLVVYDALYTWCHALQGETHNWPAKSAPQQAAQ
jgi:rhodanese-related sulfurtransferase